MRRDSIFYQIFSQFPHLLFELLPDPPPDAEQYSFDSIEVKETAFRIDGVFLPPTNQGIAYFGEVQFQPDDRLYGRINAEIALYLYRHWDSCADWRAVAIFPTRALEPTQKAFIQEFLDSGRIRRIFLEDFRHQPNLSPGVQLMVTTTLEGEEAVASAKSVIEQHPQDRAIIELASTIILYKFANLSRTEVEAMLAIELKQTRVYQEAKEEGREQGLIEGKAEGKIEGKAEGKVELIIKLLNRQVGKLSKKTTAKIEQLPIQQLEQLGEDLLNFNKPKDLAAWLENH
jgi:predicted transposase/invertase (TIGR01784 family)